MLNKIKSFLNQKEKKTILQNFFSLSFLQAANYLLPLITLPYLVRVLGPERFGLVAFAQAFIQYFMILTDFGFNLSATREISIHREDNKKVSEIFVSVFIIKLALVILSFLVIIIVVNCFEKFYLEKEIFYLTSLSVIGWAMFPQWFFQGIENMKFITLFNVAAKLLFTISIFLFVVSSNDYLFLPILNSASLFISGVFSLFVSIKYFNISLEFPSIKAIKYHFKEGWYIFLSNLFINLYTTTNSVFLGIFTNNTIVGYYSAAERILKAFQYLGMPINQVLYPYLSKLFVENKDKAILIFNKMFKIILILTFILSLLLCFFSPFIVKLVLGDKYNQSIIILTLMAWVLFSSWGNYSLGINGLINFGYKEIFTKIVLIFGAIHIIILFISINIFGYLAVPIIWIFTESAIFICEYISLKKIKIIR